jgi:hypothetical protein
MDKAKRELLQRIYRGLRFKKSYLFVKSGYKSFKFALKMFFNIGVNPEKSFVKVYFRNRLFYKLYLL